MCRAPFTTVLMAALLGAASCTHAQKVTAASATPPPVAKHNRPAIPERLGNAKAARSNAVLITEENPAPNQMIASSYRDVDRIAPIRPSPSSTPATPENSDWRYTAALLGTLAIIGTIAVRRRKAGTPWA